MSGDRTDPPATKWGDVVLDGVLLPFRASSLIPRRATIPGDPRPTCADACPVFTFRMASAPFHPKKE